MTARTGEGGLEKHSHVTARVLPGPGGGQGRASSAGAKSIQQLDGGGRVVTGCPIQVFDCRRPDTGGLRVLDAWARHRDFELASRSCRVRPVFNVCSLAFGESW